MLSFLKAGKSFDLDEKKRQTNPSAESLFFCTLACFYWKYVKLTLINC